MTAETRDWDETKIRLRRRWPALSEDELEASQGERDALLGLLQGRLGYARANAEQDLDEILEGGSVVPEDVADERTHTGTSGPVGPISDATDFTRRSSQEVPDVTSNRSMSEGERGELPNQPPEVSSIPGGSPFGSSGMGTAGGGASASSMNRDRWGSDPFDPMREMHGQNGGGMRSQMPKAAAGVAAAGVTAFAVGMMLRRGRKKHSKTEDVTEQAKRLLSDISERMPTVEEVRAKVLAIDELRGRKELKGKRFAAMARK